MRLVSAFFFISLFSFSVLGEEKEKNKSLNPCFPQPSPEEITNIDLFVEEDLGTILMLLSYKNEDYVDLYGVLLSIGGYLWFDKVYMSEKPALTWISPRDLYSKSNGLKDFMIDADMSRFCWNYERSAHQTSAVFFNSLNALIKIKGFHARSETFSITSANEDVWYSGTFKPIKAIKDLDFWAQNNSYTFCSFITSKYASQNYFHEFSGTLKDFSEGNLYLCDSSQNLRSSPNIKSYESQNLALKSPRKGGVRRIKKD